MPLFCLPRPRSIDAARDEAIGCFCSCFADAFISHLAASFDALKRRASSCREDLQVEQRHCSSLRRFRQRISPEMQKSVLVLRPSDPAASESVLSTVFLDAGGGECAGAFEGLFGTQLATPPIGDNQTK